MEKCGILGHLEGKQIVTHVGCLWLLLTRGALKLFWGPFCEGAIGPLIQRPGRTLWQALGQPIKKQPSGGWSKQHTWSSWSVGHFCHTTCGTKMASRSEQHPCKYLYFVFIHFVKGWGGHWRRTTYLAEWYPTPPKMYIYGLFGPGREISKEDARKPTWIFSQKNDLKLCTMFYKP